MRLKNTWISSWEDVGYLALILFIVGAVLLGGLVKFRGCNIERECLAAGYPSYRASLLKGDYCLKRVDQTDVVVPFDQRGKR